jgi:plastocyanin
MKRLLAVATFAVVFLAVPFVANAATHSVSIDGTPNCGTGTFCYTPGSINAKVGDKVTWTNNSTAPHTVTRCTPSACGGQGGGSGGNGGPNSPQISPQGVFSMTFTKPGTYVYYCMIHGYAVMHGTVTVAAASTPAPTARPTAAPTRAPVATVAPTPAPTSAPSATTSVAAAAATPTPSGLPSTGANVRPYLLWAAVLIEVGSVLVLVTSVPRALRRG